MSLAMINHNDGLDPNSTPFQFTTCGGYSIGSHDGSFTIGGATHPDDDRVTILRVDSNNNVTVSDRRTRRRRGDTTAPPPLPAGSEPVIADSTVELSRPEEVGSVARSARAAEGDEPHRFSEPSLWAIDSQPVVVDGGDPHLDGTELRNHLHHILSGISRHDAILRGFFDAFTFRTSVQTTEEGARLHDDSERLTHALSRAFTRHLRPRQTSTPLRFDAVPLAFRSGLVDALSYVPEPVLGIFRATAIDLEMSLTSAVYAALKAYAREARNGLTADPW